MATTGPIEGKPRSRASPRGRVWRGNLQDREIFDSDAPLRSHVEEPVWQELEEGAKPHKERGIVVKS
ncbi:hypothetical protein ACSQ67_006330 [Phaseolus vulgaris]